MYFSVDNMQRFKWDGKCFKTQLLLIVKRDISWIGNKPWIQFVTM